MAAATLLGKDVHRKPGHAFSVRSGSWGGTIKEDGVLSRWLPWRSCLTDSRAGSVQRFASRRIRFYQAGFTQCQMLTVG